jgi:hypothetical protein
LISVYLFFYTCILVSSRFLNSSHGFRQRDSLSTLLFIIVMEALSRMVARVINGGYLNGFIVGSIDNDVLMIVVCIYCIA